LLDGIRTVYGAHGLAREEEAFLALSAWAPVHGLASLAVERPLAGKGLATTDARALAEALTSRTPLAPC
jgi:hypothetical protein